MTILHLKAREAPKSVRSAMDTLLFTREDIANWKVPQFQRPIRVNAKVLALAEELKQSGGVIPGILTLGKLGANKTFYIVDGQHRAEAFKISELPECIADVRIVTFATMADMAEEFVNLNSRLVNMRPDDILRSLEESMPALRRVTENCEFVSYGQVRRGVTGSALVSMSVLLRAWFMSVNEVPTNGAPNATVLAGLLDNNEADKLIVFMQAARAAWGTDPENYKLWSGLNLTMSMWMWRRLVLDTDRRGGKRTVILTPDQFRKCLMAVSADRLYLDWLHGRTVSEVHRSPCYTRLKAIFTRRLQQDSKDPKKIALPSPSWASR
jgi:hypothetical protein